MVFIIFHAYHHQGYLRTTFSRSLLPSNFSSVACNQNTVDATFVFLFIYQESIAYLAIARGLGVYRKNSQSTRNVGFNLFNLDFESVSIMLTVIVVLVLSMGIYRPFCQLICPFGLISWIAERLSIWRIRVDHEKCTSCGACAIACPTHAAEGLVRNSTLPAECFSCGRCLKVCPVDALHYSLPGKSGKENSLEDTQHEKA